MRLDGAHRQEQLLGDLGVGVAERDQPQHLDLALGEVVGRPGRRGSAAMRAPSRGFRYVLAGGGAAHRLDQLVVGGLLEHVAERAGAERLARERGLLLHRQHDDLRVGRLLADRGIASRLEPPGMLRSSTSTRGWCPRT